MLRRYYCYIYSKLSQCLANDNDIQFVDIIGMIIGLFSKNDI